MFEELNSPSGLWNVRQVEASQDLDKDQAFSDADWLAFIDEAGEGFRNSDADWLAFLDEADEGFSNTDCQSDQRIKDSVGQSNVSQVDRRNNR